MDNKGIEARSGSTGFGAVQNDRALRRRPPRKIGVYQAVPERDRRPALDCVRVSPGGHFGDLDLDPKLDLAEHAVEAVVAEAIPEAAGCGLEAVQRGLRQLVERPVMVTTNLLPFCPGTRTRSARPRA